MQAAVPLLQTAALLDDPKQTWATNEYLVPLMALAQDQLVEDVLKIPDLGELTGAVVLEDVPANTTSINADGFVTPELALLTSVISVKERSINGRTESDWQEMNECLDVPTFTPGPFNRYYSFDGYSIKLQGATQVLDIRIFGKFRPSDITNPGSVIVPNISPILVYATAELVSLSRRDYEFADRMAQRRLAAQATYISNIILEKQAIRRRMMNYTGSRINNY